LLSAVACADGLAQGKAIAMLVEPMAWHRALGRKSRGFLFGLEPQSYLSDVVPVDLRARALSMLGAVSRTGLFISPSWVLAPGTSGDSCDSNSVSKTGHGTSRTWLRTYAVLNATVDLS
jgi:hypothetical protein